MFSLKQAGSPASLCVTSWLSRWGQTPLGFAVSFPGNLAFRAAPSFPVLTWARGVCQTGAGVLRFEEVGRG